MHLHFPVSIVVLTALLAASGCAPPPPPKFRVLMVTDPGRGLAESVPRSWQDWRNPATSDRARLPDNSAFRLADRLMDRGDMVIDVAASPDGLKPDKIGGHDALLLDVAPATPCPRGCSQALAEAVKRGIGLVAAGGSAAAFGDDPDWRDLVGATVSPPRSEGLIPLAVLDPWHPATFNLGAVWNAADRFCGVANLVPDARLLIRTATALPGRQARQPVAWTRQVGQGRVFVLTLGHEAAVRDRQEFVTVIHDAIRWTGHLVEERHNQLTLSERKAGFTLLLHGIDLKDFSGWSVDGEATVCRLDASRESLLTRSTSVDLSDLRFDFMPVKGQASLRVERCTGSSTTRTTPSSLPLNHDLPAEPTDTLWPDGWHQARVHVDDMTVRLWIDGLPAGSVPIGPKDGAKSASITWSLAGVPGSELRLRDVKCRANANR